MAMLNTTVTGAPVGQTFVEQPMTMADWLRQNMGGEWNAGGFDQAMALEKLLANKGVTLADLQKGISLVDNTDYSQLDRDEAGNYWVKGSGSGDDALAPMSRSAQLQRQLKIGDKTIGFLGDYNNDGSYGSKAADYLQGGDRVGWSAQGGGNTSFVYDPSMNGGKGGLRPSWASSSDADKIRTAATVVGGVLGAGYLAAGAGGAGAAGAGTSAAGGAAPSVGLIDAAALSVPQTAGLSTAALPSSMLTSTGAAGAAGAGGLAAAGSGGGGMTTAQSLYGAQGYGAGMSGAQTAAYDGILSATGSSSLAGVGSDLAGSSIGQAASGAWDWLTQAGQAINTGSSLFSNPLVNTLIGSGIQQWNIERMAKENREYAAKQEADKRRRQAPTGMLKAKLTVNRGNRNAG